MKIRVTIALLSLVAVAIVNGYNPPKIPSVLPNSEELSDSLKDLTSYTYKSYVDETLEAVNNGCEDHDKGSECCTILNIPLIKDHPKVCINITLEEGGKLGVYLTWDSKVLIHGSIINFNEPICAKVPIPGIGNLVELCVVFKDVEQVGNRQKGCAYLKLRLFAPVFEVKLGCFDFKV